MTYMGDKDFWQSKFLLRGENRLSPEAGIVNYINKFKHGSVLDIACGDGRNSLFFLENDFKVTSIDFSEEALERLKTFSQVLAYPAKTYLRDLTYEDCLNDLGIYDNIIICHYRFKHMNRISQHMKSKAILYVTGFGPKHICDEKIKKDDLIDPRDFNDLKEEFELLDFIENDDKRGSFVTYIYRKI